MEELKNTDKKALVQRERLERPPILMQTTLPLYGIHDVLPALQSSL